LHEHGAQLHTADLLDADIQHTGDKHANRSTGKLSERVRLEDVCLE
jgi:hypothetical protein